MGGTWDLVKCNKWPALLLVDQPQVCFESSWERSRETAGISMQRSLRGVLIGLIVITATLWKTTREKSPYLNATSKSEYLS